MKKWGDTLVEYFNLFKNTREYEADDWFNWFCWYMEVGKN